MTLKTQMTADLSVFFNTDEFAETISYTPSGGAAADISAIVDKSDLHLEPYVRGENTAECDITVQRSQVASPQHGDTFTFGGETWEYDPERGVVYKDDNVLTIGLRRRD